ncbi:MAG: PrsW family intramembrane metalloprotease [Lachnospiraceae bacterium]|nr:PrsW family intramembrane metalloprotease [Lachnospiraceae bacterium]
MTYIENIYLCLASPILLAVLCLRKEGRRILAFILAGMTACLLSAYISTYLTGVADIDRSEAAWEIAPAVEEIMKLLPLVLFIIVFEPKKKDAIIGSLYVAVGFTTFENVCYLTSYGSADLLRVLIRGFGTGALHVVCGMIVSVGLYYLWDQAWLRTIGAFTLLCFVITLHAIFNILVNQPGAVFWVGSAIPICCIFTYLALMRKRIDLA